jgi:Mg2+ and Co2+ transporter CorA
MRSENLIHRQVRAEEIHAPKRQLLFARRAVWMSREATNSLSRSDGSFLSESTKIFFRDLYDHVVQIPDTIETLVKWCRQTWIFICRA